LIYIHSIKNTNGYAQLCSIDCECKGCKNTESNSGPNGIRRKMINQILARRPDAFEPRTRDADEGRRCKKNRCLKKYCVSIVETSALFRQLKCVCCEICGVLLPWGWLCS